VRKSDTIFCLALLLMSASQRRISIRDPQQMGENPMPPNIRAPPPKPLKKLQSPSNGDQPNLPAVSEVEMEAGQAGSGKGYEKVSSGDQAPPVPTETAREPQKSVKASDQIKGKFSGKQQLQFALWAHYLSYGAAAMCICLGIFAIAWEHPKFYDCQINGTDIFAGYIADPNTGTCAASFTKNGVTVPVCCHKEHKNPLQGSFPIGLLYLCYGFAMLLFENTEWGFGLYFPTDWWTYSWRISPLGITHILCGIVGLSTYVTCMAGFFLIVTGIAFCIAAKRKEAGDGDREQRAKAKAQVKQDGDEPGWIASTCNVILHPIDYFFKIYNEDKLSTVVWLTLYVALNVVLFIYTLFAWIDAVEDMKNHLEKGTFDIECEGEECHMNRRIIRYGPVSDLGPWAKACGGLLNLNCALVLLPVTKLVLTRLNSFGVSTAHSTSWFHRIFARPLTRYVPLSKNIEFHKIIAVNIFFLSWGHLIFHYINLIYANEITLYRFRKFGWNGTAYLTGTVTTVAMFFIYSAAPNVIRHVKFEIFFFCHQWLIVFFLALLLHGPVFFYWAIIPFLLYCYERSLQWNRGNNPFVLVKVEWIPPVMAIYFRPVFKVLLQIHIFFWGTRR
jgi:hypothetical protein